jgi:CheY-like chemotaxis protein
VGIAPEDLDSIFETFKQLDNGYTKTARGVGLGLAIVKQVTDAMNGSVTVESEPGKGTSFRVLLPLGPAGTGQPASAFEPEPAPAADGRSPAASETETQAAQPAASEAETHTTRILVCEDEGINRLYIVNFLRKLGYSIDIAVDGAEAVEKAAEGSYSLILMDLGMPTMSGLEAARRIRSREREQKREPLPIIALTAHTYDEDISKCKAAGMNDFVSKPIQEARLLDTIRRWSEVLED